MKRNDTFFLVKTYKKRRILNCRNKICEALRSLVRERLPSRRYCRFEDFLSFIFSIKCGSEFHRIEVRVILESMYRVVWTAGRFRLRSLRVLYVCFVANRAKRILVNVARATGLTNTNSRFHVSTEAMASSTPQTKMISLRVGLRVSWSWTVTTPRNLC